MSHDLKDRTKPANKEEVSEGNETNLPLRRPSRNTLPEPPNNLIRRVVTPVIRMLLPIIDVDIGHTSDEELELSLVEDVDELLRDKLVEAGHESLELLLDSFGDSVLGDSAAKRKGRSRDG